MDPWHEGNPSLADSLHYTREYKFQVPVLNGPFLQRKIFRSLAVPIQAGFTVYMLLYVTQMYVNIQGKMLNLTRISL